MKRVLLVVLLLLILGVGGAAWWTLRDSSVKVLADAVSAGAGLTSVRTLSAEVAITDVAARTTSGFSLEGQVDAADVTLVKALGEVRIASQTQTGQDETVDAVVNETSVLLRPVDVTAAHRKLYTDLTGDASGTTFVLFDRSAFLEKFGYTEAVAKGASKDIRATFRALTPTIIPGALVDADVNGTRAVTVDFRFNRDAFRAFLFALVKSWTTKDPTADEYAWIQRVTTDVSQGQWAITLDRSTRAPLRLTGDFPVVNDAGLVRQRVRLQLDFDGVDVPVTILTPKIVRDATSAIRAPSDHNGLPGAENREIPEGFVPPVISPEDLQIQIDQFSKYAEELKRKQRMY